MTASYFSTKSSKITTSEMSLAVDSVLSLLASNKAGIFSGGASQLVGFATLSALSGMITESLMAKVKHNDSEYSPCEYLLDSSWVKLKGM